MLGLTPREEFRGKRLKGTAIELSNDTNIRRRFCYAMAENLRGCSICEFRRRA